MELTLFASDINDSQSSINSYQEKIKQIKNDIKTMIKYDKKIEKALTLIDDVIIDLIHLPEKIALIKQKVDQLFESQIVVDVLGEVEEIATEELIEEVKEVEAIATEELIEEVEEVEAIATGETENQLEVEAVEIKQLEDQEETEVIEDWPYIEDEIEKEITTYETDWEIYTTVDKLERGKEYEIYHDNIGIAMVVKYSGNNWLTDITTNRSIEFDKFTEADPEFKLVKFQPKEKTLMNLEGAAINIIVSSVTNKPHSFKIESYRSITQCREIAKEIELHGYCNDYKIEQDPWNKDIRIIKLFALDASRVDKFCDFLDKCYRQYPVAKKKKGNFKAISSTKKEIEGQLALI